MVQFRNFLQRLFSPKNVAPLIVIVFAVIGGMGLRPFGWQLSSEQVIMTLLAFLAVDSLVERIEILDKLQATVSQIQKALKPKVTSENFFAGRDSKAFEEIINEARKEIWIAGVTIDTITARVDLLRAKQKAGCNIRIMALQTTGGSSAR